MAREGELEAAPEAGAEGSAESPKESASPGGQVLPAPDGTGAKPATKPQRWRRLKPANRFRRWLTTSLLSLPFLALGVVAAILVESSTLAGFKTTLVSSCFGLALGAVSVSFVVLQLSRYRELMPGAPRRQLAGALLVGALAVAPIGGLLAGGISAARIAVGVIPMLLLASVLLVRMAQSESEPLVMLERNASDLRVRRHCWSLARGVRERLAAEERIDELRRAQEPRLPPPSHEIFRHVAGPVLRGDPFDFMTSLAAAAVERADVVTYAAVVERALEAQRVVRDLRLASESADQHRVRASLTDRAWAGLADVVRISLDEKLPTTFGDRCIELLLDRVGDGIAAGRQGTEEVLALWSLAADAASGLLARGQTRAFIEMLVAGHRAAETGMIVIDAWDQRYALATYPRSITLMGERAIELGDVDSLYRALEALGWIGCAAILKDNDDVGKQAIQGLVQLGRLAREARLECFWPRCLLAPVDHADERIGWVASWLPKVDEHARGAWIRVLETAWSRLRGQLVRYQKTDETDDGPRFRFVVDPSQPYTETVDDNGRVRTIDYSDVSMTKNAQLY